MREEQAPRQPRQPMTEIRELEEVETDQTPDIQMETEQPAPRITAPAKPSAKPPTKPRGTALMDGSGWCDVDPENIVTEGTRTRRSAGRAMVAEEMDPEHAMDFVNSLKGFVKEAVIEALMSRSPKIRDGKDEEEDNQISSSAHMNNSHPAPTIGDPGIKAEEIKV